jgi:hypothetical protein
MFVLPQYVMRYVRALFGGMCAYSDTVYMVLLAVLFGLLAET